MVCVAIVANGPRDALPDLTDYSGEVDIWIGADLGATYIIEAGMKLDYALGDFDSVDKLQKNLIEKHASNYKAYPDEKDETDLEIALNKAIELNPQKVYLFAVTGGRLDHTLVNVQALYLLLEKGIRGIIVDNLNELEVTKPGSYTVQENGRYPNISFLPLTNSVTGLTLQGFYYPLKAATISLGSTRCISNKLISNSGTFSYTEGILILVKSRDS
ncbi:MULTISPECIES: thiamine diphosphokinase [unclassified Virgibacillus]|uniref:thiamine diphosphokinase n=1 Tax=unclassified Virgibacillus TaxID=2620237 RepID=UPI0024DF05AA|nr:thiamine diphosphokinase [Virgibacillus sp. LDC-1]